MRSRFLLPVSLALALFGAFLIAPVAAQASGGSYTWVGNSQDPNADNHSWGDARNWSPNGVPGDGDSVSIVAPDASHCTAHVDGVPTVTLQDFSLSENPNLCGDSIHGSATSSTLTVTGTFTWNGGNLDIHTKIAAGAHGTVSGASTRLDSLTQNLEVAGSLTLNALTGGNTALRITAPNVLTVQPSGTLTSAGANTVNFSACCTDPAKIVNSGTVKVQNGNLEVDAVEVDQNGSLVASGGSRLISDGEPVTMSDGASYSGSGGWTVQDTATAVASGTQTIGSGFDLELGGLNVNAGSQLGGTATFTGAGRLNWTGGTIEGNFTFAHGFSVNVSGTHTGNGARILDGEDYLSSGVPATVTNHGTITADNGAGFATKDRVRLVNASDGTLSLAPGTQISSYGCCVDPDRITNQGTLRVPTGSSSDPVVITNVAYWTPGGTTTIAAGRSLQLTGGATGKFQNSTIAGGGTLGLGEPSSDAGTTTIGSSTELVLQKPYGTIDGTATFGGPGSIAWTGGSVSGNVTFSPKDGVAIRGTNSKAIANIGGGSTPSKLTIPVVTKIAAGTRKAANPIDLGSSTLTLGGATTVANHVSFYGGTLINTGDLQLRPGKGGEIDHGGSGAFVNRGTLALRSGSFVLTSDFTQAAGSTVLSPGTTLARLYSSYPITVTGGTLTGVGTIDATLVNKGGTIRPGGSGVGTVNVTGAFTQAKGGTLAFDQARSRGDLLTVAGAITLAGHLVSHTASTYAPRVGAKRAILTGASATGHFTCAVSSGAHASGKRAGHWAPSTGAARVNVVWKKGAQTRC